MTMERTADGVGRKVSWAASTTSNAIQMQGGSVFALSLPAGFTCTQVTFQAETIDGTWEDVYYNGEVFAVAVAPEARNIMPAEVFGLVTGRVKFVLDTTETGDGRLYLVR